MKNLELNNFFYRLQNEKADNNEDTPKEVLTKTFADILYDKGIISDYEVLPFEKEVNGKKLQINGFSFDETNQKLDLFITISNDSNEVRSIQPIELKKFSLLALNFFKELNKNLVKNISKNEEAFDIIKKISTLKNPIQQLRVFIFTDYLCDNKITLNEIPKKISTEINLFDLQKIFETSIGGSDSSNIKINFENYTYKTRCMLAHKSKEIKSYMAFIPAETLSNIYNTWGQRILNLNVRSFLQLTGKINKGMKETLINNPDRFFSYNNGISVVAEELEIANDSEGSFIKSANGFQIVNGGQTTATISRTYKIDGVDLSKVIVPAKITIVEKNSFAAVVPNISVYANTQNSVKAADFTSNHIFHVKFKELSESVITPTGQKWFYERMRGEYQLQKMKQKDLGKEKKTKFNEVSPSHMKFTKEELAKYLMCWDFKEPHVANRGAQKNYIQFMRNLNGRKFKPLYDENFLKRCTAIALLFKNSAKIIKANKNIEGYRSQVLNFLISLMADYSEDNLDYNLIWQDNGLSENLMNLMEEWSFKIYKLIEKRATGNISEWCKDEKSTEYLLGAKFESNKKIIEFIRSNTNKKKYYSQKYTHNIKACKDLSVEDWKDLWSWCRDTDEVNTSMSNLALSLLSMAEKKWISDPSEAQAEQIKIAIDMAEEKGVL